MLHWLLALGATLAIYYCLQGKLFVFVCSSWLLAFWAKLVIYKIIVSKANVLCTYVPVDSQSKGVAKYETETDRMDPTLEDITCCRHVTSMVFILWTVLISRPWSSGVVYFYRFEATFANQWPIYVCPLISRHHRRSCNQLHPCLSVFHSPLWLWNVLSWPLSEIVFPFFLLPS